MNAKDRIEAAAIELFAEKGIDGTAVRNIAQKAGVAEGALYRHYRSKDELCQKLFERHYSQLGRLLEAEAAKAHGIADKLGVIVRTAYALFDTDRALFTFILLTQHDHLPALDEIELTPVDAVENVIAKAAENGEIGETDPVELTAILFGIALQPAIFTIYGRLKGALSNRVESITDACLRVLPNRSEGSRS